jgi:hypothetical protein
MTFDACCDAYIAAHRDGWRNAKHQSQWVATLRDYASPVIGKVSVCDVDTALVCKVLEPIWAKKQTTANRLRGRIERVLDWAKVRGYREGENPARWRGHLNHLLAPKSKLQEHHAALSYADLPPFMKALRKIDTASAKALEFAIQLLPSRRQERARFIGGRLPS